MRDATDGLRYVDRPTDNFTMVANAALRDPRLSLRARGLLAMLMSYPDGWQVNADRIAQTTPEGRDAVRKAMSELTALGYVTKTEAGLTATAVPVRGGQS